MPFCNPSRYEFTELSISQNAQAQSGVYGLFADQRCVYVGEGWNVREKLLWHCRGDNPSIKREKPTGFAFELVLADQRVQRRNELVEELKPVCNSI